MIEHNTEIKTADGTMATFITHPETNGAHPVILFLMDAPGKREELHDIFFRTGSTSGVKSVLNREVLGLSSFLFNQGALLPTLKLVYHFQKKEFTLNDIEM